jgi:transmembrane sensor
MSRVTTFPDLSQAREHAALWIARMDRGLTAAERSEFDEWGRNPANARALRQLAGTWQGLDSMRALAEVFPDETECATGEAPASEPAPARRWRAALAAAVVAGVALAGAAAWWRGGIVPSSAPLPVAANATYEAPLGQRRDVPLADGSTLTINSGSAVQVLQLTDKSRELQLLRGEALFTVAHDASRPFRVQARGHVVEAVGTAFDVRLREDGSLDVVVTDGRVRLLAGRKPAGFAARGEALHIAADGDITRDNLDTEELMARVAWRHGMLVFAGEPLSTVLEEFSRYTDARFEVADPQTRKRRIGGYFPAGDTAFLLESLRGDFGLQSTRDGDGVIHIGPDP